MSEFKIEKSPIPERRARAQFDYRGFCETLGALEIGESFVVPCKSTHVANAMTWIGYALNRRFSQRAEVGAIRVGRIA